MVYTAEELAERWRVSPLTIYKLVNEGRLKAFRIQRSIRIKESDIEEFENRGGSRE